MFPFYCPRIDTKIHGGGQVTDYVGKDRYSHHDVHDVRSYLMVSLGGHRGRSYEGETDSGLLFPLRREGIREDAFSPDPPLA